jgi:hypothetical protein
MSPFAGQYLADRLAAEWPDYKITAGPEGVTAARPGEPALGPFPVLVLQALLQHRRFEEIKASSREGRPLAIRLAGR